jgi:hypothetical protein
MGLISFRLPLSSSQRLVDKETQSNSQGNRSLRASEALARSTPIIFLSALFTVTSHHFSLQSLYSQLVVAQDFGQSIQINRLHNIAVHTGVKTHLLRARKNNRFEGNDLLMVPSLANFPSSFNAVHGITYSSAPGRNSVPPAPSTPRYHLARHLPHSPGAKHEHRHLLVYRIVFGQQDPHAAGAIAEPIINHR